MMRAGTLGAVVFVSFMAAVTFPQSVSDTLTLRFISPPPNRPVSGDTRVALAVSLPQGSRLSRIEVTIDSQRVAVLEHPPFEFQWNAGEEFLAHHLEARAFDDAGHIATALLETPPLRIGQRESVLLVNLYLNVFDDRGRPLTDLTREDFNITEDGKPQAVAQFTAARQPLSVALLLDSSNSMGTGERMETARRAAIDFIKRMAPEDQAAVFKFDDRVSEVQSLTRDRKKLEKSVEIISPSGGTALYDAIVQVADRLKGVEGRKAAILLSDGRDQAFKENAPGSLHLFEEAVESVVRSEVVVYAIGLGAHLEGEMDLAQDRSLRSILETFSDKTGGKFYNPDRPGQLSGVYERITDDLGRQYSLSYSPTNQSRDGRWRSLRVEVNRPGARVVTRPGYFAPSPR